MKNALLIVVLGSFLVILITAFNTWVNRVLLTKCLEQGGVYHRSAEATRSRCEFTTPPKPVDKGKK